MKIRSICIEYSANNGFIKILITLKLAYWIMSTCSLSNEPGALIFAIHPGKSSIVRIKLRSPFVLFCIIYNKIQDGFCILGYNDFMYHQKYGTTFPNNFQNLPYLSNPPRMLQSSGLDISQR